MNQPNKVQPMPGWQRTPAVGEGAFVARWEKAIQRMAWRTQAHGLAYDRQDVASELRMAVVTAFRRCRYTPPGRDPGDPLVRYALKWKACNLRRGSVRHWVPTVPVDSYADDDDHVPLQIPDTAPLVASAIEVADTQRAAAEVVYRMRRSLSERDMALLHVRHVDGMSRTAIAAATGADLKSTWWQLDAAKARAAEFLRELGIDTWEDVEHAP